MATEAELILKLTDQTQAGFKSIQASLERLQQEAKQTDREVSGLGGKLKDFGSGLAGGFGIGAGFFTAQKAGELFASALHGVTQAVVDAVAGFVALGSQMADLAAKTGLSTDALQEMKFAGSMVGVSLDSITGAITQMQNRLVDAPQSFQKLGLSVAQLRAMKPEEAFAAIADSIKRIEDPAQQTAAAIDAFGKAGVSILPVLKSGYSDLAQEAQNLGVVMSGDMLASADRIDDAWTKLQAIAEHFGQTLAGLVVANEDVIQTLEDFVTVAGGTLRLVGELDSSFGGWGRTIRDVLLPDLAALRNILAPLSAQMEGMAKVKTKTGFGMEAPSIDFSKMMADGLKEAEKLSKAQEKIDKERLARAKQHTAEIKRLEDEKVRAMAGAMKQQQKTMEAYYKEQEQKASDFGKKVLADLTKDQKNMADEVESALNPEIFEKPVEATIRWSDALADVAHQFQAMGGAGGFIGQIAGGIASIGAQIGNIKNAAGGLGGVLSKIGSGLGIAGAAFGIGQAIFGGIKKLFGGKSDEEKRAEQQEKINKALEEQKKRIEGVKMAMGGLDLLTRGFAASMERTGTATAATQAQFQRLGTFALATFAGLVKETGDVIGALNQMGPSLDRLAEQQKQFGFTSSAALDKLLGLRAVISANQDVADSIQGLNQLMKGLGDAGMVTRDLFVAFGQEAAAQFAELQARGVDSNSALALMQPTLQSLWEQQKKFGTVTDEATAAMLRQAEEQGLVGANMMSVNEQILEVLLAIGNVLGADIPAAMRRMGDEAETHFGRLADAAREAGEAGSGIVGGGHYEDYGPSPMGYAAGGYVPQGRHYQVAERQGEYVFTQRQMDRLMGGRQAPIVVVLDGRQVGRSVGRAFSRGDVVTKSPLRMN